MDQKLIDMTKSGGLDPALMMYIGRAHNSIKDTDYTKEEVRDVMQHLYKQVHPLQLHISLGSAPAYTVAVECFKKYRGCICNCKKAESCFRDHSGQLPVRSGFVHAGCWLGLSLLLVM